MKILIVQPWISYRGAETQSVLEAYYLKKIGHEAKIACLFVDWERLPPFGVEGDYILPPYFLSAIFSRSKLAFLGLGFPALFYLAFKNAKNFDILNPHNLPATWVCALVSVLTKKPSVWIAHGVPKKSSVFGGFFEAIAWVLGASVVDKWAVKKMAKIIAVSKRVARDIGHHYGRESKVLYPVIESGFYSNGDRQKLRSKLGISPSDFLLLHLSRLHPAKEPKVSLEAFVEVAKKIPSAKLLIAGEGELKESLRAKVKSQKLDDRVLFAGFVKPQDVGDFCASANLLLVPYWRTEGCPAIPFQALLAGTVSVVAKGSGADEIMGKEKIGLVADPNHKSFAEKIIWAYDHPQEIKEMGEKGKSYVAKNMSGEVYAKKFLDSL